MAQVTVTIDSKTYRMACDDGQEPHLEALAQYFDGKVQDMRKSFGEIGDMRLAVMAAITVSDEIFEMRHKLSAMEASISKLRDEVAGMGDKQATKDVKTAETVIALAERIEKIAKNLAPA
jgi:cell division protein ZapA